MNPNAATPSQRGRVLYRRFVVGGPRERPRDLSGVIGQLRLLRDTGNLAKTEYQQVNQLFEWLNEHLPVPAFASSRWPKDAVCWFKPEGQVYIDKLKDAVALLQEYGFGCRELCTLDPGHVHYEDDFQVVASSPHF